MLYNWAGCCVLFFCIVCLQRYEDWKDGLPDLKWLEEALPQGEKWSQFSKTLIEIGGAVKDVIEIGMYTQKT